MHSMVVLGVTILACTIRYKTMYRGKNWSKRWHQTLFLFLFPPLLVLTTAIAILYMGCHGAMLGIKAGSLGCIISGSLILFSLGCLLKLAYYGSRFIGHLAKYQQQKVNGKIAVIIPNDLPYIAQIGFWQPKLVISTGLLASLDRKHLAAVMAHEQAHLYYRDTFWFFWLGWIRSFSFWLPNTEALWQELLLLRELRADRQAAKKVDFLSIAESLLIVAKAPLDPVLSASLNHATVDNRLNERIDALLEEAEYLPVSPWQNWSWVCLLILPLLTIFLHH